MGSDFDFIVVTKIESKKAIDDYINLYSDEKNELDGKYVNLCINFPIDSFILKYLEGGYEYNVHNTFNEIKPYLRDENKARIGGIDFKKEAFNDSNDIYKYKFTAVTSGMSFLFEESVSIRKWFIELGKVSNALIVYMDLEYNGNRIIYFNGKEVDIFLKGDTYFNLSTKELCAAIEMFTKCSKDNFVKN